MGRNNADFFHGTSHNFSIGDTVEPRLTMRDTGVKYAYASTNRHIASSYGPNVYKVEPIGEVEFNDNPGSRALKIYRAKEGFKVIGHG